MADQKELCGKGRRIKNFMTSPSHQPIHSEPHIFVDRGVFKSSQAEPELAKLRAQLGFGLELSLWLSNLSKITLELGSYKALV